MKLIKGVGFNSGNLNNERFLVSVVWISSGIGTILDIFFKAVIIINSTFISS